MNQELAKRGKKTVTARTLAEKITVAELDEEMVQQLLDIEEALSYSVRQCITGLTGSPVGCL